MPRIQISLLSLLFALAAPAAAQAFRAGDLDPSFGDRGAAAAAGVKQFKARTAGIATDGLGRIVVATTISTEPPSSPLGSGYVGTQIRVSRFLPDGTPDRSFGRGGTAALSAGPNGTEARDVAVTPEGGVVIAGRTTYRAEMPRCCDWVADWDFMVAKLDERGRLEWRATRDDGLGGVATAVAVDPTGGILAGGSRGVGRYLGDGNADPGFGEEGVAPEPGRVADIAVAPDGRIFVGGREEGSPVVALLDAGGAPDPAFGSGGAAVVPAAPAALAADPAGGVVALGRRLGSASVFRLTADGALDGGFGAGGQTPLASDPVDLALDRAGRMVLPTAGGRLLRLDPTGRRDAAFGSPRFPGLDPRAVAVDGDGGVIAAGIVRTFDDPETDWQDRFGPLAARFLSEAAPGSADHRPAKSARGRPGSAAITTGRQVSPARKAGR